MNGKILPKCSSPTGNTRGMVGMYALQSAPSRVTSSAHPPEEPATLGTCLCHLGQDTICWRSPAHCPLRMQILGLLQQVLLVTFAFSDTPAPENRPSKLCFPLLRWLMICQIVFKPTEGFSPLTPQTSSTYKCLAPWPQKLQTTWPHDTSLLLQESFRPTMV